MAESCGKSPAVPPWQGPSGSDGESAVSRYFRYKSSQSLLDDARRMGLAIELDEDLSPLRSPIQVGFETGGQPAGDPADGRMRRQPRRHPGRAHPPPLPAIRRRGGQADLGRGVCRRAGRPGQSPPAPDRRDDGRGARGAPVRLSQGPCRGVRERRRPPDRPATDPLGPVLVLPAAPGHARPPARSPDDRRQGDRRVRHRPRIRSSPTTSSTACMDRYVAAASLAYKIGFDFVDLKQCHRYLLNELLAARSRPGKYGGSFENRTRFILELVGRIRDAHPGRLIATRLNVFDGVPYVKGPDGIGTPGPVHDARHLLLGHARGRPVRARPGRAARPGRSAHRAGRHAGECLGGQPVREPPPDPAVRVSPSRRLRDARASPDRRGPAFPAHRRDPASLSRAWPSSAPGIAGSRRMPSRPGRRTSARAGPRSSASAAVRFPSLTSARRSCRESPSIPSGSAGPSATARP